MQAGDDSGGQRGLLAADPLAVPDLQPGHTAPGPLAAVVFQRRHLVGGHGEHQLAVARETEIKLVVQGVPHLVARPFQLALQGAGGRMVAGMDDAAVGLAGAETDFAFLFDQMMRR